MLNFCSLNINYIKYVICFLPHTSPLKGHYDFKDLETTANSITYTTQSFCSMKFIPRMDVWIFKLFLGIWLQYKLMFLLHMLKLFRYHDLLVMN